MKLKTLIVAAAVALGSLGGMLVVSGDVLAIDCPDGSLRDTANSLAECNLPENAPNNDLMLRVNKIINVILGVIGLLAVVVIILGGVSFITSQGDSGKVAKARNTILYGIVGLVIALLAFAIVNFVMKSVFGGSTANNGSGGNGSQNTVQQN